MENNLKTILYLLVNKENDKIFVGIHTMEDPERWDRFYGEGITGTSSYRFLHPKTPFQLACKKYGLNSFKRYILNIFDNYEDALAAEKAIVNEEFIKRSDNYNFSLGGRYPNNDIEVHKYSSEGHYIETYRSLMDVEKKLGFDHDKIHNAILTKTEYGGFYWSESRKARLIFENLRFPKVPVYYYNKLGVYKGEAASVQDLAIILETSVAAVQRAIRRKASCGKYFITTEKVEKFAPKKDKRKKTSKVYQYDRSGNFVAEYENLKEAKKAVHKRLTKAHDAILDQRFYEGSYWSYDKYEHFPVKEYKPKRVAQYDLNGELVTVWPNYRSCAKEFPNAYRVLNGTCSHTNGYKFEYIDLS